MARIPRHRTGERAGGRWQLAASRKRQRAGGSWQQAASTRREAPCAERAACPVTGSWRRTGNGRGGEAEGARGEGGNWSFGPLVNWEKTDGRREGDVRGCAERETGRGRDEASEITKARRRRNDNDPFAATAAAGLTQQGLVWAGYQRLQLVL